MKKLVNAFKKKFFGRTVNPKLAICVISIAIAVVVIAFVCFLFGPIRPHLITSPSMVSTIPVYATVIADRTATIDDFNVGDIVIYRTPEEPNTIVHRVKQKTTIDGETYLLTCGDDNQYYDSWTVTEEKILGKYITDIELIAGLVEAIWGVNYGASQCWYTIRYCVTVVPILGILLVSVWVVIVCIYDLIKDKKRVK